MTTPSSARTLPFRFLRRAVQPYALAVSLAIAVTFASMLTESGVGLVLDGWWGKAIGLAGGASTVLLWWGWWRQSPRAMNHGLLLSAAVWSSIAAVVFVEGVSWPSASLSVCWAVASGGAWLLEVNDKGRE